MVLFVHNRYRTTGGEERVLEELMRLVRGHLGEPVELLSRDSGEIGRARAATGLLRGGIDPAEVAGAVRSSGARVVHAHNLQPTLGWRALAAARAAGARVVLHLHQYRLVCAIGVCFTRGAECTRCHGRHTLPGVRLNCRGNLAEAGAYGASLALWQRRMADQADAVLVPSRFALERLRQLDAPLRWDRVHVLAPPLSMLELPVPPREAAEPGTLPGEPPAWQAPAEAPLPGNPYALVVSRLSPEKGIDVAIDACAMAGMPLLIAGEGPERAPLAQRARAGQVSFLGALPDEQLARLRAGAAIALVPSRSAETFGLAAAEAMAAGVPVAGSRVGALPELLDGDGLVEPGDPRALAEAIRRLAGDRAAGERGAERVRALCAPRLVAARLAEIYDGDGPVQRT